MNDIERRIQRILNPWRTRITQWLRRSGGTADLRREASARAQRAATDLRDSDAAKRAATALQELRESDAAKRAGTALTDLRDSDAAKRAASALADLRQRDAVRKAEESAKRALHDLRSGRGNGSAS
jgi:hypothetical protein